jgi:NADPH-dependent curcumin reductase CurA
MTSTANRQFLLVGRPEGGQVAPELFELREAARPEPGDGQILIRNIYLSLDPAMRGWISEAPNYRDPVPLGALMPGFTVGEVAESRHPDYAVGEIVAGRLGWQDWALSDGTTIDRKVDPAAAPITTALHVMGHTGLTAYLGLLEVGQPKDGETVVVSTAAGAVGSTVGQIAKIKGCRAVGLTGSDDKVETCLGQFGFDAAINYKTAGDLEAAVGAACPDGVDVYYDNVGGEISDAVIAHLNVRARIVVCGTMGIPDVGPGEPQPPGPRINRQILIKRARMEGFLVLDHLGRLEEALADLGQWVRAGRLAYTEDIVDGLENAPEALARLLAGRNTGKMITRVGDEPG